MPSRLAKPCAQPHLGICASLMHPDIKKHLSDALKADIAQIQQSATSAVATQALRRLQTLADHFPAFLALLAEPWLAEPVSTATLALLTDCARVHLYARILDDALDENLPVHRQNLLRAQPLLWQSIYQLAAHNPALAAETTALISETVNAVQHDDARQQAQHWGPKNHHLLLAPLLLSGNSPAYQSCRAGLSTLITLVQAGDEWHQGVLDTDRVRHDFLTRLPGFLEPQQGADLTHHGWPGAAQRIVWESRQLVTVLSS